jgi:DNA-binding GntR family transcriptional regulator
LTAFAHVEPPAEALAAESGATHAERLRRELADAIADGRLAPGTALDETGLAQRFGVSRTPVREALRQLAAAGLIVHRPHRGAQVARVSDERLDQMFQVMADLEAAAAGYAAAVATAPERAELESLHAHAAHLVQRGDRAAYAEANDGFHAFIYRASHNDFLLETVLSVRARVNPFRRAQFASLGRLADSHHEHDLVVEAILRGDRDAAARHMRDHLMASRQSYSGLQENR